MADNIIATDWADFYAGREQNFLMQQTRNLANPEHRSSMDFSFDSRTGNLKGMDRLYVTSERVGDRVRFNLHFSATPVHLPAMTSTPAQWWGWADDFANSQDNFKVHTLRRLQGTGNSSPGMHHVSPNLPLDAYDVESVSVNGRVRFDLCVRA